MNARIRSLNSRETGEHPKKAIAGPSYKEPGHLGACVGLCWGLPDLDQLPQDREKRDSYGDPPVGEARR